MKQRLTFDKGLNADALPNELGEGFVSDCSNVRFRKGFAEIVGGTTTAATFTSAGTGGELFKLYTSAAAYVVMSTSSSLRVYTVGGGTATITRNTEGVTVSSATAAGTTVTITTATNHGLITGNTVSAWGFTPSTYNVESASITRLSATTFSYVVPSAPAVSPATLNGMYSADSSGTSNTSFTTGGELAGVMILGSTSDGCYYWSGNTSIPVRKIVGSYAARSSVAFGNFVVQLAPTISGTEYASRILWSTASDPGSVPHNGFTAAATNQAGSVDKPEIGEMVHAEMLGQDLVVYGTKGRILMRYIGGNDVFSFTRLPGEEGLYSTRTLAATPNGHVFVDNNRHVRFHTGGVTQDISEGRVQAILGAEGYSIYKVVSHPRQNEIWISYRTDTFTPGNSAQFALIWNWVDGTWGKTIISNAYSAISITPSTTSDSKLYFGGSFSSSTQTLVEYDRAAGPAATFSIERAGLDAGDTDVIKNLQRSRWNIDSDSAYTPTYTVQHGSSMYADTAATYASGVTYTPGTTDYANSRATGGRFMAVKLSGTTSTTSTSRPYYFPRVRSADLDFTLGGKR